MILKTPRMTLQGSNSTSVTATALRKAQDNYANSKGPLEPCTSVFTTTAGLPCAHKIDDIRQLGRSLLPSDFHPHWYYNRYSAPPNPILGLLRMISYTVSSSNHGTRRIPSGFEASEPRERRCGLCKLPGHTRASLLCMVNLRRLREALNILEDSTGPEVDPDSLFIPRSTVQTILDSALPPLRCLGIQPFHCCEHHMQDHTELPPVVGTDRQEEEFSA